MGMVMVDDMIIFVKYKPVLHAFGWFSLLLMEIVRIMFDTHFLLYGKFGILDYFVFGDETIITTSLGQRLLSNLVKFGLCMNFFFTFLLMMNPIHEIVEQRLCNLSYCLRFRLVVVLVVSLVVLKDISYTRSLCESLKRCAFSEFSGVPVHLGIQLILPLIFRFDELWIQTPIVSGSYPLGRTDIPRGSNLK
ncbi:amino acid transporter AVT3A-like [Mercurialis annua]|uniref:amino acid transporter AVT3A-like n=1 Tax=Mercurialis annua TaxID=3986 RepID=UPI0024AD17C2|nr:amino acid transporter AVT3A-like [Mercurialis annua]